MPPRPKDTRPPLPSTSNATSRTLATIDNANPLAEEGFPGFRPDMVVHNADAPKGFKNVSDYLWERKQRAHAEKTVWDSEAQRKLAIEAWANAATIGYGRYNIAANPHHAIWGVVNDRVLHTGPLARMVKGFDPVTRVDILRKDAIIPAYYSRDWLKNHHALRTVQEKISSTDYPFLEASTDGIQAGHDRLIHFDQGRYRQLATQRIRRGIEAEILSKRAELYNMHPVMREQTNAEIAALERQYDVHGVFLVKVMDRDLVELLPANERLMVRKHMACFETGNDIGNKFADDFFASRVNLVLDARMNDIDADGTSREAAIRKLVKKGKRRQDDCQALADEPAIEYMEAVMLASPSFSLQLPLSYKWIKKLRSSHFEFVRRLALTSADVMYQLFTGHALFKTRWTYLPDQEFLREVNEAFRQQWGWWEMKEGQTSPGKFKGWDPCFFTATDANKQKWICYAEAVESALVALGRRSARGFKFTDSVKERFHRLFSPLGGENTYEALASNPQFARRQVPILCPNFLLYCDSLLENAQHALREVALWLAPTFRWMGSNGIAGYDYSRAIVFALQHHHQLEHKDSAIAEMIVFFMTYASSAGLFMSAEAHKWARLFSTATVDQGTLLSQALCNRTAKNFAKMGVTQFFQLVPEDIIKTFERLRWMPDYGSPAIFRGRHFTSLDLPTRLIVHNPDYSVHSKSKSHGTQFLGGVAMEAAIIPRYRTPLLQGDSYSAQMRAVLTTLLTRFIDQDVARNLGANNGGLPSMFDWPDAIPCDAKPIGDAWLSPGMKANELLQRQVLIAEGREFYLSIVRAIDISSLADANKWGDMDAEIHDKLNELESLLYNRFRT